MATITTNTYLGYAATHTDINVGRVDYWIPVAERWVARQAGRVFYDATNVASDPSQDWQLVVCMVIEQYLRAETTERLTAANSPYKSYSQADGTVSESYSLKADAMSDVTSALFNDARIMEIIDAYRITTTTTQPVNNGLVQAGRDAALGLR